MKAKRILSSATTVTSTAATFCLALILAAPLAAHAGGYHFRGGRQNANGGISAFSRNVMRGSNGNYYKKSGGVVSDGSGNALGWHTKAYQAPNGTTYNQSSGFTRGADGAFQRKSYRSRDGVYGSATSTGEITRSENGEINAAHSTSMTANNGANYEASTTYDPESGLNRTTTYTNQYGEVVEGP